MNTIQTPHNPISGVVYQGQNVPALINANDNCMEWATFLQWSGAGYKVIKGSKGTGLRTFIECTRKGKNNKVEAGHAPRYFRVFSREQVEEIK